MASEGRPANATLLSVKIREAGFGGGQGFFFFAEGEADLGSTVLGMVIETGAGNAGDTDVLDEVFGEGNITGIGRIFRFGPMETRNVGHDVIRTTRFVHRKAGIFQNREKTGAFFRISGGEVVVIALRKLEGQGTGLLKRSGGTYREEIVNFSNSLRCFGGSNGPADAPASNAIGFGHAVDDDGAVAHAIDGSHGDVLSAVV